MTIKKIRTRSSKPENDKLAVPDATCVLTLSDGTETVEIVASIVTHYLYHSDKYFKDVEITYDYNMLA